MKDPDDSSRKPRPRQGVAGSAPPEPRASPSALPDPPDLTKVRALRDRIRREQTAGARARRAAADRSEKLGRRARDIGSFTIIPMLMIAGPAVGYGLGVGVAKLTGGAPWPQVGGMLLGLVAGFRQVYLLLKRRADEDRAGRS